MTHKNTTYRKGIYCFTDDLRLQDNIALADTIAQCHEIAFIYVVDVAWFKKTNYQHTWIGNARWQFIQQSLHNLHQQLSRYGHQLTILHGQFAKTLSRLIQGNSIDFVGYASQTGTVEQANWQAIERHNPKTRFLKSNSDSLFEPSLLKHEPNVLDSFSRFRRFIEKNNINPELPRKIHLDALPHNLNLQSKNAFDEALAALPYFKNKQESEFFSIFTGGEQSAYNHCNLYFSSAAPSSYKETRNALNGWQNSTKFSPFLANGNISARQLLQMLKQFEASYGANESTYWIYFELLWREYFHQLANKHGVKLYRFSGIASKRSKTSYFAERFNKWCAGNTPYPIVNACMKQLNQTGFMSNRGRQLVASCFINELNLDWRYGAAYFQQQLVDHDLASNWGNWQYIAGVGVDPRGGRHFNLEKQTSIYDPEHQFITKWQGQQGDIRLDSTDAADWPVQ